MQVLSGIAKPGKSTELTSTTTTNQDDITEDNGAKAKPVRVLTAVQKAYNKEYRNKPENKARYMERANKP